MNDQRANVPWLSRRVAGTMARRVHLTGAMSKKLAAVSLGLAALVLSPFAACSLEPPWEFGAREMRAAVEGTWTIRSPADPDTPGREYTVIITQSDEPRRAAASTRGWSLVAPASACGSRSFVRTASACVDGSSMPLDVQLVDGRMSLSSGDLVVLGRSFHSGRLEATVDGLPLRATISPGGGASDVTLGSQPSEMVRAAETDDLVKKM
jgi:hypothetical protein